MQPASPGDAAKARLVEGYGRLPLRFERNEGQADGRARYLARGPGYTMFITPTSMVLSLRKGEEKRKELEPLRSLESKPRSFAAAVLRVKLLRARREAEVVGLEELPGKSNYFIGNDPKKWRTDIASYARVECRGVYPGIDLHYHGSRRELEYDFVVAPRADPSRIRLGFEGAQGLRLDLEGNLVVTLDGGEVVKRAPRVYQEEGTKREPVRGHWILRGRNEARFELGAYDRRRALVIDPVLSYSTYLGGYSDDRGYGIAVDGSGSAYVTGETYSMDFPTQNPYQSFRGVPDAFVTKLSPSGDSLVYSTYLGGSYIEEGYAVAVDALGSAYVTGETFSTDFPMQNPYQSFRGVTDAFLTKLSPSGNSLVYSTYLGGGRRDNGFDIALDSSGSAYVTGSTDSTDFPAQNPYQADQLGVDAFVAKLSPSGNSLVSSTYLGGSGEDVGRGITVDSLGSIYVTGYTGSPDFPTLSSHQADQPLDDAFVTKLSPPGNNLVYSTYLGGNNIDRGWDIAVDRSGSAYVTGYTNSLDFPTQSPYQTHQGSVDAFVTKVSASGDGLVYSTYLGGSDIDYAFGIALDSSGSAYLTGGTNSTDFPTRTPLQTDPGAPDAFVTRLSPSGDSLVYSTYLGGSWLDEGDGIAVDGSGSAYVTGMTYSPDFPTQNPYQMEHAHLGSFDAFVTKLGLPPPMGFFTVSPCRLIDTRNTNMPPYALEAGTDRPFTLPGQCGIPPTARAVAVNITVTSPSAAGHLRLYAAGSPMPPTSSINYTAGQTRANNAIVGLNSAGVLVVYCAQASGTAHFILDVNGYFE